MKTENDVRSRTFLEWSVFALRVSIAFLAVFLVFEVLGAL